MRRETALKVAQEVQMPRGEFPRANSSAERSAFVLAAEEAPMHRSKEAFGRANQRLQAERGSLAEATVEQQELGHSAQKAAVR